MYNSFYRYTLPNDCKDTNGSLHLALLRIYIGYVNIKSEELWNTLQFITCDRAPGSYAPSY
jgi:hypothetical protein